MPAIQSKNKAKVNGAPPIPAVAPQPRGPVDLTQVASCLKLEFHNFGNSKKVNTERIALRDSEGLIDDGVKKSRLRASKKLLESPELRAIDTFDGQVDKYVKNICLPFDIGIHLVPHVAVTALTEKLKAFAAERTILVEQFIEAYPVACQEAAVDLNSQYRPADYPSIDEVRRRFGFSWRYLPFGQPPPELKGVSQEVWNEERAKAADRMAEATAEIQLVLREAMCGLVEHLSERLTEKNGKAPVFFKSTVTNLTDFMATFDFRNITDDAELQAVVAQARKLLGGVDLDDLKQPGAVRARIAAGTAALAAQLDGLVRTGRKFRDED